MQAALPGIDQQCAVIGNTGTSACYLPLLGIDDQVAPEQPVTLSPSLRIRLEPIGFKINEGRAEALDQSSGQVFVPRQDSGESRQIRNATRRGHLKAELRHITEIDIQPDAGHHGNRAVRPRLRLRQYPAEFAVVRHQVIGPFELHPTHTRIFECIDDANTNRQRQR